MRAEELRLGNEVEGGIVRMILYINGFLGCFISSPYDSGMGEFVKCEDLKPVALTEEWLLAFGFEKIRADYECFYYSLELNEDAHCDLSIMSGDKNGFLEIVLFPYEKWMRYKYVHQLQNLYFALTGNELQKI